MTKTELTRITLAAPINEASGMARLSNPAVLDDLGADEAWYVVHDEGDLHTMVSVIIRRGVDFSVEPLSVTTQLPGGAPSLTDAEAIAIDGDDVLVVGSAFVGPKGDLDERRSFIVRLTHERGLDAIASTIELGTALLKAVDQALTRAEIEVLSPSKSAAKKMPAGIGSLINVEGAVVVGDDLVLGLRWPSTQNGQPLLATVRGFRPLFNTSTRLDVDPDIDLNVSVVAIPAIGTPKRPAGFRAMAHHDDDPAHVIHAIVGPTDRKVASKNKRAAPFEHVRLTIATDASAGLDSIQTIETFEGYRKVEALSPTADGGWIYGLDDDDAIVLLTRRS